MLRAWRQVCVLGRRSLFSDGLGAALLNPDKMATRCTELIITEDTLRGTGVDMDPYRRVTQVFTKDGELLAERDPSIGSLLRVFAVGMTGAQKANFERIIKDLP